MNGPNMLATAPLTTDQERVLGEHDFIVSKTDLKGRITYGNRIFAEYAGYTEKEFLGKIHNIVRHPDMPKAVFKLLWDRIQAGQEVFAFVKNRCKHGGFYWVFANVTASYDLHGQIIGYYSVRRKPNPQALPQVMGVYRQLLQIEKAAGSVKEGMDQALAWLQEQLQAQGTDYDSLVSALQKA
jgi:PAS domain S-box-containing protein